MSGKLFWTIFHEDGSHADAPLLAPRSEAEAHLLGMKQIAATLGGPNPIGAVGKWGDVLHVTITKEDIDDLY